MLAAAFYTTHILFNGLRKKEHQDNDPSLLACDSQAMCSFGFILNPACDFMNSHSQHWSTAGLFVTPAIDHNLLPILEEIAVFVQYIMEVCLFFFK